MTTYLGLSVNLAFPKFDWTNETQIVKQGTAMMITVFGNMALAGVPIFVISNTGFDPSFAVAIWTLLLFIVYRLVYRALAVWGTKKLNGFEN